MSEPLEIARRLDAIYDTELTNRLVSSLSSPSYTLAEIEALARKFTQKYEPYSDDGQHYQYTISIFILWLKQRERDARDEGEEREGGE